MNAWPLAGVVFGLLLQAGARAELEATPLPGDARLVQFEYDADNTYLILSRPKAVTHVEFGPDEQITTVAGGDTKHWELTPTANRKHLFIKPVFEQTETSMTVITDKRSYQFVLRSTGEGAKWYQRVTWRYGQKMLMELRAQEERSVEERRAEKARAEKAAGPEGPVDQLDFDYRIEGAAPFRPTTVFSDGRFTFIRLPPTAAEWPALFSIVDENDAAVVNYVVRGDYMVAQQVVHHGLLKLGRAEVRFGRAGQRSFLPLFRAESGNPRQAP